MALVGAGPGDAGLVTAKGLDLLRAADVVVYDAAVGEALLREARRDADLLRVDERDGQGALRPDQVCGLLVDRGRAGKRVVRLAPGDPFASGRGGEEAEALAAAGVAWEVVPGVIEPVAAPAYAGMPLGCGDAAQALAVSIGGAGGVGTSELDADADTPREPGAARTLAVHLHAAELGRVTGELAQHGWPAQTPAAVVWSGTTSRQRTRVGTLADIAELAGATNGERGVLVVGAAVERRARLRWFDARPLMGRCVVITRAPEQAPGLIERLEGVGAEVVTLSAISIEPADDLGPLDAALGELATYDWVLFTSANGVRAFARRLWESGRDWRALHRARVGAIGPATARELGAWHVRADFMPHEYVAEGMLAEIGNVAGQRVLLPRTDIARATLAEELRLRGAEVNEVVAYRTVVRPPEPEALRQALVERRPDAITFTSSSTVRGFVASIAASGLGAPGEVLRGVAVACIGPVTAATAREHGLVPAVTAEEYTMNGLTDALVGYFGQTTHESEGVTAP